MVCQFSDERLAMVRIGTTDVSPQVLAPTVRNIKVCACHDNPVGDGAIQAFQYEETGRYLVVLLEQTQGVLTLCEVKIFGGTVPVRTYTLSPLYIICAYMCHILPLWLHRVCLNLHLINIRKERNE